jgi:hypothetical protein
MNKLVIENPVGEVIDAAESYDGYTAMIDTGDLLLPKGAKLYTTPPKLVFNFCPRCGKRLTHDPDGVHTCTPPQD